MAAVGGGGGGEDPNRHLRDFEKFWKSQHKITWNPLKIGALPGGSKSVAVFVQWHGNAQMLCGHIIRYSKTPFFVVGVVVVGGVSAWYKENRDRIAAEQDNRALQARAQQVEQELRDANAELRRQAAVQRQMLQELQRLNTSWFDSIKKWFG